MQSHSVETEIVKKTTKGFTDHFTVVCSVTWLLNGGEARGDLALIQTSLLLSCKCFQLVIEQLDLPNDFCIPPKVVLLPRIPENAVPFLLEIYGN